MFSGLEFLHFNTCIIPLHGSLPCHGEGACVTQRSYEPWLTDHSGEFWKNVVHWRRGCQITPVFCCENYVNSMIRQKDMTSEVEPHRSEGVRHAPGKKRKTNICSSRKNVTAGPKWKRRLAVDVFGSESKVQCCKEQYCIITWNVSSVNQGQLDVVKQEMVRVNLDILGISELKRMGMDKFNSEDHYIY